MTLKNSSEHNSSVVENAIKSNIKIFSQSISQTKAWSNGTGSKQIQLASQVLCLIQKTSFTAIHYLNRTENSSKTFESKNLYEKLFLNTENFNFEYNSSKIVVPKHTYFMKISEYGGNDNQDNGAFGVLVNNLGNYLTHNLTQSEQINSEIIGFSLRNTGKTLRAGKYVNVR